MIIKLFEKRKDGRGIFVTKCKKCSYFTPHKDDDGGYCKKLSCYFSNDMFCGIGRKWPEDKLNERQGGKHHDRIHRQRRW